ncbi:glycoside hydrolase family protein [Laribacter hongkongensis]|uniref:glycoside hydrolase family protein n=1 Tax=Laribacter hongkongensis TaxID=168471 RepID=UPI00356B77B8
MRLGVGITGLSPSYATVPSPAYNIGSGAFCGSTLVRKLNAGDYAGACSEINR